MIQSINPGTADLTADHHLHDDVEIERAMEGAARAHHRGDRPADHQTLAEIEKCATNCDFYAAHVPDFLAAEPIASDAGETGIVHDLPGVVLAVRPWNEAFWQVYRFAAPAIAAGNGAILKPAANVSGRALAIEARMAAAGWAQGLMRAPLVPTLEVAG